MDKAAQLTLIPELLPLEWYVVFQERGHLGYQSISLTEYQTTYGDGAHCIMAVEVEACSEEEALALYQGQQDEEWRFLQTCG